MKRLLTLVVALGLWLNPAFAQAAVNTAAVRITRIDNWVGGNVVYVRTSEATKTNPNNCANSAAYVLPASSSDFSRSMVLTAFVSHKPIILGISEDVCSGATAQNPRAGNPVIVAIVIQD